MLKNIGWATLGDTTAKLYQKLTVNTLTPATNHVKRELIPQIADTANLHFMMR